MIPDSLRLSSNVKGEKSFMKSGSVVTTVALLLAALGFAKPNSPAKVHADTITML